MIERYTFRVPNSDASGTTFNIPIEMDFQLVDQGETIERQFVDVETEKAINPIIDYEKVRFTPSFNGQNVRMVTYNVNFWNGPTTSGNYFNYPAPTTYADIGFIDDDLRFRKNSLIKSVLTLNFYDSPIVTDQNLVSIITINPDIRLADIQLNSQVNPASFKPLIFSLGNPLNYNEVFGEGFFIYHYKDEVNSNIPKELYMRASFKNAKTGKLHNMMTIPFNPNTLPPFEIDELQGVLHTKYTLIRTQTGYYYELDATQANINVVSGVVPPYNTPFNNYEINLFEIRVT
jgi:hypothetical protein